MHRRRFLQISSFAFVAACTAGGPVQLAPNSTLIVIRHADRDGELLSARGVARSQSLVSALDGMEIDAIYSPGLQRNLDTAAPLSAARGLPIERRPQENPAARLAQESAGRTVLWVGNKGNIASIWDALSLPGPAPLEYGDLHIIRSDADGRVTIERLHFGV